MPLEMYDGKTGSRLIARAPVSDGSYAVIKTEWIDSFSVYAPEGLVSNGHPALTPDMTTIPAYLTVPLEAKRQALRNEFDRVDARLGTQEAHVARILDSEQATGSVAHLALALSFNANTWRDTADSARRDIEKTPICTSIMVGRRVSLKLPKGLFEDLSTIELGEVLSIEIHNP